MKGSRCARNGTHAVSGRQGNYYRRALTILGLVAEDDTQPPATRHRLTAEGRAVAEPTAAEAVRAIAHRMAHLQVVQTLHHDGHDALVGLLEDAGLTGETLPRRARTVQRWHQLADEHGYL